MFRLSTNFDQAVSLHLANPESGLVQSRCNYGIHAADPSGNALKAAIH
jgi:hypothetical protein